MELIGNPERGKRSYPFEQYTDGQWRLAKPGEDYDTPGQFVSTVRAWAARHGYKASVRTQADGMAFQLTPKESE